MLPSISLIRSPLSLLFAPLYLSYSLPSISRIRSPLSHLLAPLYLSFLPSTVFLHTHAPPRAPPSISMFAPIQTWPFPWPVELVYHNVIRHLNRDISLFSPLCLCFLSSIIASSTHAHATGFAPSISLLPSIIIIPHTYPPPRMLPSISLFFSRLCPSAHARAPRRLLSISLVPSPHKRTRSRMRWRAQAVAHSRALEGDI